MSEEETEIEDQIGKKQKKIADEVIEIRHTDERESSKDGSLKTQLESEKKRREELELIVEAEATKTFMTERDNLLQKIPESQRKKLEEFISDDPERLQQVKASMILQGQNLDDDEDEEDEITPSGRARLPPEMLPEGQRGQSRTQMYDNPTVQKYSDLYAIIRDPKSTVEQKAEAENILDETFSEIKKGLRIRAKNNPYSLPTGVVNHCMRCGFVTEIDLSKGTPCPSCGYRFGIDDFPRNPKWQPR